MTKPAWSPTWPTEQGAYWFHGFRFQRIEWPGREPEKPQTHFVEVWHDGAGNPMYVTCGHFLYKSEGASGLWLKAELPAPPGHTEGQ